MNNLKILVVLLITVLINSCQDFEYIPDEVILQTDVEIIGWGEESHSVNAQPNYAIVFNQTTVNRIDIVLTSDEYQTMQSNLATLASGGTGPGSFSDDTPVYVAADFYFNNTKWFEVGVRYKGNSTLYSSYNQNIGKLPLRFKFDKFEDDYPEIMNQRFYGFKDLSMSSNYNDESFMREKIAPDLFREFGVAAPQTAFYEVWVDQGNGSPIYYGLYTMVEVVHDTMLTTQFGNESGNCYKPDGDGAKFSSSGFSLNDFEKKTNENSEDWSDVQALYDVLHSTTRTTNEEQWKTDLEAIFDVDEFLKYLAVNNTIQNWDTYGNMTHNYYLYNNPDNGKITWIPWDNNEAFMDGPGPSSALSFEMNEVSNDWPLISYLTDVSEYRIIYDNYIDSFINGVFDPTAMTTRYSNYDALISASAQSENPGYTFLGNYSSAITEIKSHCSDRNTAADAYLN
jgi:spore coat protein CotH